jgi:hypothetical protein
MTGHARKLDILVISAGQAGLAWGSISKNARGSALFAGVGEDAAYLTEHIVKRLDHMVAP